MKQCSVSLIGSSELFRAGLQLLLKRSRFTVVQASSRVEDAMQSLPATAPQLLVCAFSMGENPVPDIQNLSSRRDQLAGVKIVLLTGTTTAEVLREASAARIDAVLSNDITSDVLRRSLELVLLGQQLYPASPEEPPPRPTGALIPFARPGSGSEQKAVQGQPSGNVPPKATAASSLVVASGAQRSTALSDREQQILRCLVAGAANKMIARDLCITEATVKVHIKGLLRKIRVSNRTQAAVWGLHHTFDDVPSRHAS